MTFCPDCMAFLSNYLKNNINETIDLILVDLREALNNLGEINGNTATEDVVDSIFKNFCVGK